ncbi:MAG: hypothetical protein ACE3JK_08310 [Sporolactobacillus sp.]
MFSQFAKKKSFIIIASLLLLLSVISITLYIFIKLKYNLDSDIAAEMLLGKEILTEHQLFPAHWYYSTEIRFLNIQLLFALFIKLTGNLLFSKSIANFLMIVLYGISFILLMISLKIKKNSIILNLALILTPLSTTMLYCLFQGAFYTAYIIFIFCTLALWIKMKDTKKKSWVLFLLFYISLAISLFMGMQGTRMLVNLYIPLAFSEMVMLWLDMRGDQLKISFKNILIRFYFTASLLLFSAVGFIINRVLISGIYHYSDFGVQSFSNYQDIGNRLILSLSAMVSFLGGIGEGNIISIGGVSSVLKLILILLSIIMLIKLLIDYKHLDDGKKSMVIFTSLSVLISIYLATFSNILIIDRYFINGPILLMPIIFVFMEQYKNKLVKIDKYIIVALIIGCIILSQYSFIRQSFISNQSEIKTKQQLSIIKTLERENLNFGYATFWNADILSVLSNDRVKIANFGYSLNGQPYLWLTPARYYTSNYHKGSTFLLLTKEEYKSINKKLVKGNTKILRRYDYVIIKYRKNPFNNR